MMQTAPRLESPGEPQESQERHWADYERELKQANASRLPAVTLKAWTPDA